MNNDINYPTEWNDLPRNERRKKIKGLKRKQNEKASSLKKIKNLILVVIIIVISIIGYKSLTQKSPEQVEFEQKVEEVSLENRVEEFEIEGRDHVSASTTVEYQTNPPTSGGHLSQAENWGVYSKEINDKAGVHSLEHGGIWISYKDIDEESIETLEEIGKLNAQSVVVSPRSANDDKIVVASWGKFMRLETVNKALIQKYIDTYKNQSPEKIAR